MGYAGQTFLIPQAEGGFQYRTDREQAPPTALVGESRNFNLDRDGRRKRGGTQKVSATAVSGAPRILGIFDYITESTSFQVFLANDGSLYKNMTTAIKTGMSTTNPPSFEVFDGKLFVCDGESVPQVWDGITASTSDITTPALDWTTTPPFQFLAHGKGASRRLWALNKNGVYFSTLADGEEFDGGSSGLITVDTGDAEGLVGGVEFGDRLIVFGRYKAFVIDDTDTDTANWGYQAAQWYGGVAHWRLIVKTPNDVVCMTEDGEIYSFTAVQSYGDYKQASIARPAFIDNWLREIAIMSRVAYFHAIYDPTLRAIRFFISHLSGTQIDSCLLYYVDRGPEQGWALHDNRDYTSGFNASAACVVKTGAVNFTVYTGDYAGFLWKLEQSTYTDDGNAYTMVLRTPRLSMGDLRSFKEFKRLIYSVRGGGDTNLTWRFAVDGVEESTVYFQDGTDVWDEMEWDEFNWDTDDMIRESVDIGTKGRVLEIELEHNTANQELFLGTLMLDFKPLGALSK